ncbi:diguanylate cyclase [Campylobacterota bacterium DY0563]
MRKSDTIYWKHKSWIVILTLSISFLLSYTSMYDNLKNYFNDTIQYLASEEKYFTDSVVVDINNSSLKILEKDFGHWPYTRDKYVLIIEFLQSMNVKNIVFDINFADPRVGDDIFKKTIAKYNNVFFVTSALKENIPMDLEDKEKLKQISWSSNFDIPALKYKSLLLPHENIFNKDTMYKLGITSVLEDNDGLIRSIPMLYNIDSNLFPSLLLRIQFPHINIPKLNYDSKTNELLVDKKIFHIDQKSRIKLFYPQNANSIISIPFYKISEVALNKKALPNNNFLKNKTVFIGSSAFLSDRINTPRGAMSGSYLLAITYESLKNNLIIKEDNNILDFILLIIAILFSLYLSIKKEIFKKDVLIISILTIFSVVFFAFIALKFFYLETNLFLFLLIISFAILFTIINYQVRLSKHNEKLVHETKKLYNEANCDTLTGLLNRRGFDEQYRKNREISQKISSESCVAIIDLDRFKSVNDTYGHDIGDLVLQKFANLLKEHLREIDIPARWGGEEFVILLRDTTIEESIIVLNRLREKCQEMEIETPQNILKVTISIGVTKIENLSETIDIYVKKADIGLYKAKETGRNKVCIS